MVKIPSSPDCPVPWKPKMFVRKLLVSLLFAAVFAEALADHAAVENAASMSTVGTVTAASDQPVS